MTIIERLQENKRAFGLMAEDLQKKAKKLDELGNFLSWTSYHWKEKVITSFVLTTPTASAPITRKSRAWWSARWHSGMEA